MRYKARKKASDAKITNIMPMMIAPFRLIRNQSARLPNMVSIIKDIITPVIPFVILYFHFCFFNDSPPSCTLIGQNTPDSLITIYVFVLSSPQQEVASVLKVGISIVYTPMVMIE